MLFLIHKSKLLHLFALHLMDQKVSPSFDIKVSHIGALHAETKPGVVLLFVFRIAFPASLLKKNNEVLFKKCTQK